MHSPCQLIVDFISKASGIVNQVLEGPEVTDHNFFIHALNMYGLLIGQRTTNRGLSTNRKCLVIK